MYMYRNFGKKSTLNQKPHVQDWSQILATRPASDRGGRPHFWLPVLVPVLIPVLNLVPYRYWYRTTCSRSTGTTGSIVLPVHVRVQELDINLAEF